MIGLMFPLVKDKKAAANVTAINPAYTAVISVSVPEWSSFTLANTMTAKNDARFSNNAVMHQNVACVMDMRFSLRRISLSAFSRSLRIRDMALSAMALTSSSNACLSFSGNLIGNEALSRSWRFIIVPAYAPIPSMSLFSSLYASAISGLSLRNSLASASFRRSSLCRRASSADASSAVTSVASDVFAISEAASAGCRTSSL